MKFVLNKGNVKIVKYTSGNMMTIPDGMCSLPDNANLELLVSANSDLSFVTKDQFLKSKNIVATKEKIETAKKEKSPLKPPKKKKTKPILEESKPEEKQEEVVEEKIEEKSEK